MSNIRARLERILPTLLIVIVIFSAGFFMGTQSHVSFAQDPTSAPQDAETEAAFGAFWQAFHLIKDDYLDDIPTETLVNGAIEGMMDALNDDFSAYMDPEIFPLMTDDLDGDISGIGVVIQTNEDDEIEVVSILRDSPAEKAGVQPGDIFAAVDGEDMTGISQTELATRVRGEIGTPVDITFRRGTELIDLRIVRARIEVPVVSSELLDGGIGHVTLWQFSPTVPAPELRDAILTFDPDELNGLILDFRTNPGGLLNSAIDVASLLVDSGTVVIEDFGDSQVDLPANGTALGLDIPIVLLVDETSASASELVAGAWQDYGLVTVMGETTFGKGTVQTWNTLVNGGGIRLTIARWLTPEGHWIHQQGITPDIEVEWTPTTLEEAENDVQLQAALDYLQHLPETADAR